MGMGRGPWDWTRNEDSAKAMLNDKLDHSNQRKRKPWEEKAIKILLGLTGFSALIYIILGLISE